MGNKGPPKNYSKQFDNQTVPANQHIRIFAPLRSDLSNERILHAGYMRMWGYPLLVNVRVRNIDFIYIYFTFFSFFIPSIVYIDFGLYWYESSDFLSENFIIPTMKCRIIVSNEMEVLIIIDRAVHDFNLKMQIMKCF
jgi:hypothetical protein